MNFDLQTLSPTLRRIYDYWLGLCPAPDQLPARDNISPHSLKPYLPYIALVEKRPPNGDYHYRLVGTGITGMTGYDPTGRRVANPTDSDLFADTAPPHVKQLVDALEQAEKTRAPFISTVTHEAEDTVRKFHRMVLPLADDGTNINMFMCYADLIEV